MTSYRMKTATFCAAVVVLICGAPVPAAAQADPGNDVYKSLLYLWEQAPSKFSEATNGIPWNKLLGGKVNGPRGIESFSDYCDIPEFEKESAMAIPHKNSPTSYSISAKRYFTSDAACLSYYQAMLAKLPGLMKKYQVKIKVKDDHVFYRQKTDTYNRSLYVKYYPHNAERKKQARVYVSVQVVFPQ